MLKMAFLSFERVLPFWRRRGRNESENKCSEHCFSGQQKSPLLGLAILCSIIKVTLRKKNFTTLASFFFFLIQYDQNKYAVTTRVRAVVGRCHLY